MIVKVAMKDFVYDFDLDSTNQLFCDSYLFPLKFLENNTKEFI